MVLPGRPGRHPVRSSGGGKSVGTGIAISAVLLAAAVGAVLYTNSQPPIGTESRSGDEPPKKKKEKPAPPAPDTPGRRLTTDIFSKDETIAPKSILTLVLSSDKKGQIEFEILPKDGAIDASMVRVKSGDAISEGEQATLREKLQRFEAGKPAVLRAEVLAGEVQYCQVSNPGDKPVQVTATGRTITSP